MRRGVSGIGLLVAALAAAGPAAAEETASGGLTVAEVEALAVERFPEVQEADARVRRLEAELSEVRWSPLSGVKVRGLLAPTPERRGDAIHAAQDDISFSGSMGVLVRAEVTASFPLYTFGRLTAERDAAREAVEAGRGRAAAVEAETRLRVHRAYWALVLATETEALLDEGRGYIGRAQDYIEERLEADEGGVTETDRLRVEVLDAEVEARAADARKARRLAAAAVRLLGGLGEGDEVALAPLSPVEVDLRPLAFYLKAAEGARPEVEAARAEARAAAARVRAAKAAYLPELRAVGELTYSYSDVVDDQASPFVNDPFNYFRYGLGLALRWDLDLLSDHARVRGAEARRDAAEAGVRRELSAVALEVEDAHASVEEGLRVVEARRRARRAARGWMVAVLQGIDVGVLEPEELVDALRAYFEQGFQHMEAVARLNTAVAALEVASGLAREEGGAGDE